MLVGGAVGRVLRWTSDLEVVNVQIIPNTGAFGATTGIITAANLIIRPRSTAEAYKFRRHGLAWASTYAASLRALSYPSTCRNAMASP